MRGHGVPVLREGQLCAGHGIHTPDPREGFHHRHLIALVAGLRTGRRARGTLLM